jgi:hypothetical protein
MFGACDHVLSSIKCSKVVLLFSDKSASKEQVEAVSSQPRYRDYALQPYIFIVLLVRFIIRYY